MTRIKVLVCIYINLMKKKKEEEEEEDENNNNNNKKKKKKKKKKKGNPVKISGSLVWRNLRFEAKTLLCEQQI